MQIHDLISQVSDRAIAARRSRLRRNCLDCGLTMDAAHSTVPSAVVTTCIPTMHKFLQAPQGRGVPGVVILSSANGWTIKADAGSLARAAFSGHRSEPLFKSVQSDFRSMPPLT
jgi:hypothetical protein